MPKVKLIKKSYDLFLCHDCKNIIAYEQYTGDGHKCPVCNSPIFISIGNYKYNKGKEFNPMDENKKIIIQAKTQMKDETITELEDQLSGKLDCKVVILPFSLDAGSLQIVK